MSKRGNKKGYKPWNTGLTKETDIRVANYAVTLSVVKTGVSNSLTHNAAITAGHIGLHYSSEHCAAIVAGQNRPEVKIKMKRPKSEEHKRNIGKSHIGKKHSEDTKKKMRKLKSANLNPSWKGGISLLPYPFSWTNTLKESIRQRDSYVCQLCGKTQEQEIKEIRCILSVHHIDYNKNNLDLNNLISLCRSCNSKVNGNRKYWINYFIMQMLLVA